MNNDNIINNNREESNVNISIDDAEQKEAALIEYLRETYPEYA